METVAEQVVETVEEVVVTPKKGKGFAIAAGVCVCIIAGKAIYHMIKAKRSKACPEEDITDENVDDETEDCDSEE